MWLREREEGLLTSARERGTVNMQEIEELLMQVRERKHCQCEREMRETANARER